MNKEEKSLLLKDLCARLPYNVIVRHADSLVDSCGNDTGEFWYKMGYLCNINKLDDMTTTIIESEGSDEEGCEHICLLERTVPYLRPMSSMTEKEKKEYYATMDKYTHRIYPDSFDFSTHTEYSWTAETFDWLNKKMFAYRTINGKSMFELGLAIEASEEMYK